MLAVNEGHNERQVWSKKYDIYGCQQALGDLFSEGELMNPVAVI